MSPDDCAAAQWPFRMWGYGCYMYPSNNVVRTTAAQSDARNMTAGIDAESRALFAEMLDSVELISSRIVDGIMNGEHAYVESTLELSVLESVVAENVEAILLDLAGSSRSLEAPRRAGRVKAASNIPMAGLLHAYRLAGLQLWEEMMVRSHASSRSEALLRVASAVWGIIDKYSNAAADAYREVIDDIGRKDQQAKSVMLLALLEGEAPTSDIGRLLRALGLSEHATYLVVAAELKGTGEDPMPGIAARLRAAGIPSAWATWKGEFVGLLGCAAETDATLATHVISELAASRIGVSRTFTTVTTASEAVTQARLAMQCIPTRNSGVHLYGAAPLDVLIARDPTSAAEVSTAVLGGLTTIDSRDAELLLDTLEAWFVAEGSTSKAARILHCHRNTVLHRLAKMTDITGRSVGRPSEAAELYIALRVARLS